MERKKKLVALESPLNGYMEDAYPLTVAITKESSYECDKVKDVALYIEKIDEMIERKRKLLEE